MKRMLSERRLKAIVSQVVTEEYQWKKDWMPDWMDDHAAFEMTQELENSLWNYPKEANGAVSPANIRKAAVKVCKAWEFDAEQTQKFIATFTSVKEEEADSPAAGKYDYWIGINEEPEIEMYAHETNPEDAEYYVERAIEDEFDLSLMRTDKGDSSVQGEFPTQKVLKSWSFEYLEKLGLEKATPIVTKEYNEAFRKSEAGGFDAKTAA